MEIRMSRHGDSSREHRRDCMGAAKPSGPFFDLTAGVYIGVSAIDTPHMHVQVEPMFSLGTSTTTTG